LAANITSYTGSGTSYDTWVSGYNQSFAYTAFNAASPTQTVALFSVPAFYHIIGVVVSESISGVVNTSGTTVTWVSGNQFTGIVSGNAIVINGVSYTTTGTITATSLSVTSTAGTQTGVVYTAATPITTSLGTITSMTAIIQGANAVPITTPFYLMGATSPPFASYDGGFYSSASQEGGTQTVSIVASVANLAPGNLGNGSTSNLTGGVITVKITGVTLQ